ncbi:hypothetical protein K525DRAFT_274859 [Schizophyllum commune Loenen D]|nr:hypothetical protein K525DRAFT_274859 [Schizophyllum commune Loenen D]
MALRCNGCNAGPFSDLGTLRRHNNKCPRVAAETDRPFKNARTASFKNPFAAPTRPFHNIFNKRPRSDSQREGEPSAPASVRRRHVETPFVSSNTSTSTRNTTPSADSEETEHTKSDAEQAPAFEPGSPMQVSPESALPSITPNYCHPRPPSPLRPALRRQPLRKSRRPLVDTLPEGPEGLDLTDGVEGDTQDELPPAARATRLPRVILHIHERIRTLPNHFRLVREYRRRPHISVPDQHTTFEDRVDVPKARTRTARRSIQQIIHPYPTITAFLLGYWQNKGSNSKTLGEFDKLQNVMDDPRFVHRDATGFKLGDIYDKLAKDIQAPITDSEVDGGRGHGGWRRQPVTIDVPTGVKATKEVLRERAREAGNARRQGEDYDAHARLRYTVPDVSP